MRRYALQDVRIVDLAGYIAGAYTSGLLADMGAQVDKVESFDGDAFRGIAAGFQSWNRGKRGIVLNLRTQEGREALHRMVGRADVVVENYRHGVAERLGADYETLRGVNPRIIYCTVTAYGARGDYASVPGFDPLFQAMSGAMAYQGGPDAPPVFLRVAISDYAAAIMAAWGVVMALYHRRRTGQGQHVEVCLMNSVVAVQAGEFLFTQGVPWTSPRVDDLSLAPPQALGIDATHRLYRARDAWLYLACDTPEQWRQLCQAIGQPGLDALWTSEGQRQEEAMAGALAQTLAQRPAEEWLRRLGQAKLKAAPLPLTRELSESEDMLARGLTLEVDSPEYGALRQGMPPFSFSATPASVQRPAPMLGQHTSEILAELGYSPAEIMALRQKRVIP
ncbi:MAG: CoA transferase [Chloroflexi bacterium]|nr:CoA transferase [Chloroflexota bacterium]